MLQLLLQDLQVGETALIVAIVEGNRAYRAKLLALGLLPGTLFQVIRKAPLGDPIELQIRGYRLTLRQGEAALLKVQKVE